MTDPAEGERLMTPNSPGGGVLLLVKDENHGRAFIRCTTEELFKIRKSPLIFWLDGVAKGKDWMG
jgi:hypothetical protein